MSNLGLWVLITLVFSSFILYWALPRPYANKVTIGRMTVPLVFLLALTLRIVLAASYVGYAADMSCFSSWADRMATLGPSRFYAKDYFSDYPPLYLYILTPVGFLKNLFSIERYSGIHLVLLKLPSILSDMAMGYVIYREAKKHLGLLSAIFFASLFLFHPAILLNSSIWGQVDAVFTLFVVLVCVFLERQNLLPAMLFYGLGVLMKPQMLIFTPLLILGTIHYVFRGRFSIGAYVRACAYALLTMAMVILLAMPFGLNNVYAQYFDTIKSCPYASVNAYNFWSGMGLNWYPQDTKFCGVPCNTWGFTAIVLATAVSIILGLRLKTLRGKYAVVGSFLIISVFTFSVRMHERYLYPVIPLMILGLIGFCARQLSTVPVSKEGEPQKWALSATLRRGYLIVFTLISALHFYNTGYVLYYYDPATYKWDATNLKLAGILMTVAALAFFLLMFRLQTDKELALTPQESAFRMAKPSLKITDEKTKMTKLDLALLLAIMVAYSCFALYDLGDNKAPESVYSPAVSESMTFEFPEGHEAKYLSYYIAPEHNQEYLLSCVTTSDVASERTVKIKLETVFCWKRMELPGTCKSLTLTAQNKNYNIIELVFLDEQGNPVTPLNASEYANLFDEADLYPDTFSFRNSTYFDEIYHARTAYEYLHGMRSYENTHPPFGKILISLGITIFGMNPFGWRIIGTLIGIAMLPVLYCFAKKLTGDTPAAALTCFIFAFDFIHFAQTRIATIDVYIVFFVLCMYYFLYLFLCKDYAATPLKKLLIPLGLCGISMGFGVASKWTGIYAGLGMGLLFLIHLIMSFRSASKVPGMVKPEGKGIGKAVGLLKSDLGKRTIKIIGFCLIFFVLIPIVIYLLSYIPFRDNYTKGLIERALRNQQTMYNYHSNLEATHYFASPFYEWPVIIRPIWYYSRVIDPTMRETINSFGNPLVWWASIPAFCYMIYLFFCKKDKRAGFLIIGYASQYLPWVLVTRLTFIYHYFPSVVFLVLMIGYSFRNIKEKTSQKTYLTLTIAYAALIFALFIMFYPVLSGQPVDVNYVTKYLKWFKTWVLVAK
ncbi:MAG: phospholipid carrier-dependent glycosyltransferase [Lachnospiraceae bacterium]|nr:phospholipid carrier-dependent glycosyltransferase [Lachnospiraceae bacterium]